MKRLTANTALFLISLLGYEAFAEADAQRLRIYNWNDYFAPETIAQFESETGIKVQLETFESSEILAARMFSGQLNYDVIVPANDTLASAIELGVLQPLQRDKLSNWHHLDTEILAKLTASDPGNEYATPYLWGTTGMGVNVDKVEAILGSKAPIDSLALIFDPKNAEKLASCGITLLDSPIEVIPEAFNFLGIDGSNRGMSAFKELDQLLAQIQPFVSGFESDPSSYIDALVSGESCVVLGYSGDLISAQHQAEERGVDIRYTIPKEGSSLWFDMFAIPRGAQNVENAHTFINFMLRPEVIAAATNYLAYPNANASADALIAPEIRQDPLIYPPAETLDRLNLVSTIPLTSQRNMTRSWARFKNAVLSNN